MNLGHASLLQQQLKAQGNQLKEQKVKSETVWYKVFHKKDGKQKRSRKFIRCKICINYSSVVTMNIYQQWIPTIATVEGIRYREEVAAS